jgi:purine-cytosine permease-like protein
MAVSIEFTSGWNPPAVAAWTVGAVFGVLAVNTTLYVGPLADIAGGVDVSTVGSAVLAGVIYIVSLSSWRQVGPRADY